MKLIITLLGALLLTLPYARSALRGTHQQASTSTRTLQNATTGCNDLPGWQDVADFDCSYFANSPDIRCDLFGDSTNAEGVTANQACCVCGGGHTETEAPATPPPQSGTESSATPPPQSGTESPSSPPPQSGTESSSSPPPASGSNTFQDPMGDSPLVDIISVQAQVTNVDLEVSVTFNTPPESFTGIMIIDLDQDPTTGIADLGVPGAEAVAGINYDEIINLTQLSIRTSAQDYSTLDTASVFGNTLAYSIPLSSFGDNINAMDLSWALAESWGADFDRVPDVGMFATDSGQVVTRLPGNPQVQVDISDTSNDETFPNMNRLQAEVIGDQLQLILTYTHPVEVDQLQEGMDVYVYLDTDKSLCTGFDKTGQLPSTLGVDDELRLMLDPLLSVVPELWHNEDGFGYAKEMGVPLNDMFMRLTGNQIVFRIPLSYLGFSDGRGAVSVMNTNEDFTTIDRLPDTGAWDLETNQALPGQQCKNTLIEIVDPSGDSFYGVGGDDNDDLVGVQACLGVEAILLTIAYESFQFSNDGATLVYIDTDRNPATGEPVLNIAGETQIGAEYWLVTCWDPWEFKQFTMLRAYDGESFETENMPQLTVATNDNRIYITIPLDCIGNPSKGVNLVVQTASWATPYTLLWSNDELPSIISLPLI